MKIINEYPPNIKKIRRYFNVPANTIFTYGDTIYNPNGVYIDEHLMKHEAHHTKQQGDNASVWWNRYFVDDEFRLEMELECYIIQAKSFKASTKDREAIAKYIYKLASDLSSEMYGNIISFADALKAINK